MVWAIVEQSTPLESKVIPVRERWRTFQVLTQTVLGSEVLVTRDPENVKALFLTHASSFEIGASRCVSVALASSSLS